MDLLIEFIVWVIRSLAGENEQAKRRSGGGLPPVAQQRGPYNYGDGRPAAPTSAPRPLTLEEILEEVKRQQKAKQSGQPAQGSQTPAAQPESDVKRAIERAKRKAEKAARKAAAAASTPAQTPEKAKQRTNDRKLVSSLEHRAIDGSRIDEKEFVRPEQIERKFDELKVREERRFDDSKTSGDLRFRPLAEQSATEVVTAATVDGRALAAQQLSYSDFFKTLRNADPKTRLNVARHAIIVAEVFGPPVSRRGPRRAGIRHR